MLSAGSAAAGIISGGGSLTKQGSGKLTLQAANTYTGTTSITQGTLQVDGSTDAASAVSVLGGATLSGDGTVGGTVTSTGGTVSPGLTLNL